MTKDEELIQEMRDDAILEAKQEAQEEYLMRTDWDYALDKVDINPEMTLKEFGVALHTLQDYGWDISAPDLMDEI